DYRWPGAELDQLSVAANDIVAMRPDVVVSRSTPATAAIRNRGVPIVFVLVTDPKGSGFVQDLGRPGDTLTGFSTFEASVGSDRATLGRWFCRRNEGPGKRARVIGAQRYRRRFYPRDYGGHASDSHNTHHFCSKF